MGYFLLQLILCEKGNILKQKVEGSFLINCFVMFEFNSVKCSSTSWSRLLAMFLWNVRSGTSDCFEDYTTKGNILR